MGRELRGFTDLAATRRELGLASSDLIILVTTKEREARAVLGRFLEAAASLSGATVVIKPHPAETAEAYAAYGVEHPNVRVLPAGTSLAKVLAVARAVVTVNSTVAIDAGAFDVPALVLGLPNNLSPFVDAGVLAGTSDPAETAALLGRILYDEQFRQRFAARRRAVLGEAAAALDGRPALTAAEAVLTLVQKGRAGGP
jgi:hypothetical protein